MSTMRDVAKQAGVSAMTVSRVLNDPGRVHPSTRDRVLAAMASLRYVPSQAAPQAALTRSRTIALVVTDLTNPFFTQIARGVESMARRFGYGLILHNTAEDPDREWESLVSIREARVDGVIWVPCGDVSNVSARILIEAQVPTVLVDRIIPGVPSFDAVISDNRTGARVIVSQLLANGSCAVATVMSNTVTSVVRDRFLGLQDALAEHHVPWDEQAVVYCDAIQPAEGLWSTIEAKVPRASAVFAWNQIAAAALFREMQEGIQVPSELMIATFGNPDPYGITPGYFIVAQQDPFRMGMDSAKQLLDRLSHPDDPSKTVRVLPVTVQVGTQAVAPMRVTGGYVHTPSPGWTEPSGWARKP